MYTPDLEFNLLPSSHNIKLIENEKQFVLNTSFSLGEYVIDCGLSAARNFSPAVKISTDELSIYFDKKISISFDYMQWLMLIEILNLQEENDIRSIDDIIISTTTINGFKMIHLSRNESHLHLINEDISKIFDYNYRFLKNRLELMIMYKFDDYYKKFIRIISEISKDISRPIRELINLFCNSNPSIHNCILNEALLFVENKILYDINQIRENK
ncbi:hypothetical protein WA026_006215 [Henosepilachna vigintioctopunctata]|uniref:Uncharacterized protein n=1 Tax=Henosepilachna vigintioctopunctata TaxID=420089 RepID=A0AAW1TJ07_9CUCU